MGESNQVKALLRTLSGLCSEKDIPNRDYFDILKKSVQLPKKELIGELKNAVSDWQDMGITYYENILQDVRQRAKAAAVENGQR